MFVLLSGMFTQLPHDIWSCLNMKETFELIAMVPFLKAVISTYK